MVKTKLGLPSREMINLKRMHRVTFNLDHSCSCTFGLRDVGGGVFSYVVAIVGVG
jgi:hypothetical protein